MGKKSLYLLSIIAVILLVFFLDFKSKNIGLGKVYAYYSPLGTDFGPGLVNSFETGGFLVAVPTPPYSVYEDIKEWHRYAPAGIPTPTYLPINGPFLQDGGVPSREHGLSLMRITWEDFRSFFICPGFVSFMFLDFSA
ncbi:MAG TPA: hypothetical protein PK247_10425, partial [Candidatus Goldiibacteriota bacterium]|nr:hypothetical protein [Candidatus Goldiibacteriota bacterium]